MTDTLDAAILRDVADRFLAHIQDGTVTWTNRGFWDDIAILPKGHPAREIASMLYAGDQSTRSQLWWLHAAIAGVQREASLLELAAAIRRDADELEVQP